VENNLDPMQLGRVQVSVPAVLGSGTMSWAMPCVPFAGPGVGLFLVPPVGANVWVEFEAGNPDYPILAGCFWGTGEVPASPAIDMMKMLKTDSITITMSDVPGAGGLKIEVASPAVAMPSSLDFATAGVKLECGAGSVELNGVSVSVNQGALEVI
jgi:hypothetical protein